MPSFLQRLAEAILARHGHDLRTVAVVLPSERAGLHLRHALARAAGTPLWSPELLTLNTCTQRLSGMRPMPMEELLFEAFEAYRGLEGAEVQTFGEFLQWAPTALHDMSEADAHLVPLDGFYRDLRSWEELEWSFNDSPLSPGQERMVRYWTMKGRLHVALGERLKANGTGTIGAVERAAAEGDAPLPWKAIWFAGLNALTPAQERMLDRARRSCTTYFAWDADQYYLRDTAQEAGTHLRHAIDRFGQGELPPTDRIRDRAIEVELVSTATDVAQAWCAARLLNDVPTAERDDTVVVLANGQLLPPLLEALPAGLGALNVTMGTPVAALPAGSLLDSLLQLHAGMRPGRGYFHQDVERLLRHPFLQQGIGVRAIQDLLTAAAKGQRAFVPFAWIEEHLARLPETLRAHARTVFTPVLQAAVDMPLRTQAVLAWARELVQGDPFPTEQLYQAAVALHRIHHLLATYHPELDLPSYSQVHQRLLRTAQVGLFGEPLQGAQVMGMLETRAMDHRRIIVLSAQEGDLPSGGHDRSFIPFELRRAYAMPLRDSTDAVQAYNFFRMFHAAEHVTLVYTEGGESKGRSRYLLQLQHEMVYRTAIRPVERHVQVPLAMRTKPPVTVYRDEAALSMLRDRMAKGLSPSAIGTWLACPLDHHLKYVLRVQETEEVAARIAPNVLGGALHTAVERIFTPWLQQPLVAADLRHAMTAVPQAVQEALAGSLPAEVLEAGEPLLQLEMATQAAQRFLEGEAERVDQGATIVPLALECPLEAVVPGAVALLGTEFRLAGRLDRVDLRHGAVHILDLKTGGTDEKDLELPTLSLEAFQKGKSYAMQLLTYAWLYLRTHPEVPEVKAGLLPMRRPSASGGLYLQIGGSDRITQDMLPAITDLYLELGRAMLDPERPVQHDPTNTFCRACADVREG